MDNPFKNAKVGDIVQMGSYPQNVIYDQPIEWQVIEWQVLAIENNRMLIISRYGLEERLFGYNFSNSWENSDIRKWLNNDFYNKAFTDQEKKSIKPSNLSDVGTSDNVFLLSKEEAKIYFVDDEARKCKATEYAIRNDEWKNNNGRWGLRSPYPNYSDYIYIVSDSGDLGWDVVYDYDMVIRPALWINL